MNNGKAKIENTIGNYTVSIPSKKNWFTLLFGTAWLGGWTIGGIMVVSMLLWGYFGKEKLEFDQQEVKLEKTIFGIGIKKRLIKKEVTNFRFEKISESMFGGNRLAFWGLGPGKIKFDYGLKTYSFGLAVDDAEANYLSEELNKKTEK